MSEDSNILSASVPIKLDGQDYVLRYRALAFIRYAEECRGDLINDIRRVGLEMKNSAKVLAGAEEAEAAGSAGAGFGNALIKVRDILWAGLVDAQPMFKRDDVARLIDFRNLNAVMLAISEAIKLTMPESEPDRPIQPRPNPKKSRPAVGPNSGLSSETPAALLPSSSGA